MDFAGQPAESRETINTWVEERTVGKIKDLIPEGSLSMDTALVLINAIYFKGTWEKQFKKEYTRKVPFFIKENEETEVDMMCGECLEFPNGYSRELKCLIVELPYVSNELSMVVLLPREKEGLSQLEEKLNSTNLQSMFDNLRERKIEVFLPKFKMEQSLRLSETLSGLGMKDFFQRGVADLSGMDGTRNLYVSKVVHKACIDVNEEGTEAAAATAALIAVEMSTMCANLQFYADHPFMFLIMEKKSSSVLFLGRYAKP